VLALQQVIDGLANGAIYAALALALVLVHRATGVVNFAQGEMAVASAYVAWTLTAVGVPVLVAVPLAVVGSVALGAGTERLLVRRFGRDPGAAAIVLTIGLLIFLNGMVGLLWGYVSKPFPSIVGEGVLHIGSAAVALSALVDLAVLAVVVIGLQLLFLRTRFGLALRATADNAESSALLGLPVGRLLMAGWGLAAALGALAGCLIAPKVYLDPGMMDGILIYALAAAILGGLDSPLGAVVAALAIGVTENLAGTFLPFVGNDLRIAVPLVLMCVVLLLRPQGLFGRREVVWV
jgi:branched-chain amino acid transport system permease protein